jgi:hypothetical protein
MPTGAAATRGLGHAGDRFAATLGEKERKLTLCMPASAYCAGDGLVRLAHRADRFKNFIAILANIFVNWHFDLYNYILPFFICG